MKSIKLFFVNALILFIGVGLMTGAISGGKTDTARLEKLPELEIQGLKEYKGQYLTVFYALGSRPFFSTDNSKIHLSQIKDSRSVYIASEKIRFASTEIEKEGFRPSYNIVVFVVSKNPNYTWVNANGESPQGLVISENRNATFINAVNKTTIDKNLEDVQTGQLAINLVNL